MDRREENHNSDVAVQDSDIGDQVSIIVDNEEIAMDNKSEVDESEVESPYNFEDFAREGMVMIGEAQTEFEAIKRLFIDGMGSLKFETTVVSVQKCLNISDITMQARMETFRAFSKAMARKRGGESNEKKAWYGASKEEICQIVSHGFSRCEDPQNDDDSYGVGIYLSPKFSLDSAIASVDNERRLRHVLLCRVIMGKMEQVRQGSKQILPSSLLFDSGVDDLTAPTKYIIWGAFMNTHILPEYLISFKTPGLANILTKPRNFPVSQWMSRPTLISSLSNHLPRLILLISKSCNDYKANKISQPQMILRFRELAGDNLLTQMIRANPMNPMAPRN